MAAVLAKLLLSCCLCMLTSNCAATKSILSGGNLETRPVRFNQELAPVAEKKRDGSLLLTVHFETTKNAAFGELFQFSEPIETKKLAFVATRSSLQPAVNIVKKTFPNYDQQMLYTMFADPRVGSSLSQSGSVKVIDGWPVNGSQLVCPPEECVILGEEIVWYVPGNRGLSDARAAVIPSPSNTKVPLKALPMKALLLPLGLLGDAGFNTWFGVAASTGKPIDL